MKTQLEKTSTLGRKLNIEVPATIVATTIGNYLKDVQKRVEIKGFRKGKVPLPMVKSLYEGSVKSGATEELLRLGLSAGLKEHQVHPVDYPEFEFEEVVEGDSFHFSAHFEVTPEVELKVVEGLEVTKEIFSVDPTEVDKVLENIRKARTTKVDLDEDRPAQVGDVAVIDFKGVVDGDPLEGGAGEDHPLVLGSQSFIPGFEDGIVGMKIGEVKTLSLRFPENYQNNLSNKDVNFEVTLKKLQKEVLPELTDELVQSFGGGSDTAEKITVEKLKANILADLEARQKKRTEQAFEEVIKRKLLELNPVEVPQAIVRQQKGVLIQDMEKQMKGEGYSAEQFAQYKERWDADFEATAKRLVQLGFLFEAIAAKYSLHCTKEDLDAKLESYAAQSGIDVKRVREHYSKAESMDRLASMITEDKVISYILSNAKVTETQATKDSFGPATT